MLRDKAHLLDMLEAARKISGYAAGKTSDDYYDDDLLQDGIERNLITLGEAARRVSNDFRFNHPEIPWEEIIAERNVMVHEYDSLDESDIWHVVTVNVPDLITILQELVGE